MAKSLGNFLLLGYLKSLSYNSVAELRFNKKDFNKKDFNKKNSIKKKEYG